MREIVFSADAEYYPIPISDVRIMFDSEKQRDEFKALLEKEEANHAAQIKNIARIL